MVVGERIDFLVGRVGSRELAKVHRDQVARALAEANAFGVGELVGGGNWNDVPCTARRGFICERN